MKRRAIIIITLILLAIIMAALAGMYLVSRRAAVKNGAQPLSFRQFVGLGDRTGAGGGGSGVLTPGFNDGSNGGPAGNPGTTTTDGGIGNGGGAGGPRVATSSIMAVSRSATAQITTGALHGLTVGSAVTVRNVPGIGNGAETQGTVLRVDSPTSVTVDIDTSGIPAYTGGGTLTGVIADTGSGAGGNIPQYNSDGSINADALSDSSGGTASLFTNQSVNLGNGGSIVIGGSVGGGGGSGSIIGGIIGGSPETSPGIGDTGSDAGGGETIFDPRPVIGTPGTPGTTSGATPTPETSLSSECTTADVTIAFTDSEIERLNALQERFYAIATTLRTDADVKSELANYDNFKLKLDRIIEMNNYCQSNKALIPTSYEQKRVPTPFWRDPSINNKPDSSVVFAKVVNVPGDNRKAFNYSPYNLDTFLGWPAGAREDTYSLGKSTIEAALRLNIW